MSCHAKSAKISTVIVSKRVIIIFKKISEIHEQLSHNINNLQAIDSCQDVSGTRVACWVWLAPPWSIMTLEWHAASRIQMKVQRAHPRCEIPHVMQSVSKGRRSLSGPSWHAHYHVNDVFTGIVKNGCDASRMMAVCQGRRTVEVLLIFTIDPKETAWTSQKSKFWG